MQTRIGISQDSLKILACLTMLIDHIGAIFFPQIQWLRIIGRLSFPIYCFLLAEGIHYTRDMKKYGLRLLLIALIVEYPYDLLFVGRFSWAKNSVMVTLLLGYLFGALTKGRTPWVKLLVLIPLTLVSRYTRGTYGMYGFLMIAMFLLTRELPYRNLIQLTMMVLLSLRMAGFPSRLGTQIYAIAAMVPIALYSGEKRSRNKALQWAFTLFYPVHILILLLIQG